MSEKGLASDTCASGKKKPRRSINVELKLDNLRCFDVGERLLDIARVLLSLRTICVIADKIKECA